MDAALVIDYQNVHITGSVLFYGPNEPLHKHLIHPGLFADTWTKTRNSRQRKDIPLARITHVEVYRGLPSSTFDPKAYGRNLAQKAAWERDPRVGVTHRALQYPTRWDGTAKVQSGPPREKGIDVLCALAVVRLAASYDLVVLASQDTDLEPALDAGLSTHTAKIETVVWNDGVSYPRLLRPSDRGQRIWTTHLDKAAFDASRDPNAY